MNSANKKYDVVIIGGGIAGLYAALVMRILAKIVL